MSDFESKCIASSYSSSDTEPPEQRTDAAYMAWREIRESSVADFVNHVAGRMDALYDRAFRSQLYEAVFSNGDKPVRFGGVTYTSPMLLDLYRASKREGRSLATS